MNVLKNDFAKYRERLKTTDSDLYKKVDASPFDLKTKELAKKSIKYESTGSIGYAIYNMPPVIERGNGAYLYDADGKEYIDFLVGFSVSALGNNNPEVTKIIQRQTEKLTHFFDFPHIERVSFAEDLCKNSKMSGDTKVVWGVTGSDSIELATRAARYYTGKPYILTAYGDYHGVTYGTMGLTSKGGMQPYFYPVRPISDVGYFHFPHDYRKPGDKYPGYGMEAIKMLERSLDGKETPFGDGCNKINNVAAILVEPFQSSAGYYIPPVAYLQELRRICDKFGIILIVDEIQAGLGRSGKLWAFEHSGIEPDMICTSKALGGGLPLAAVISRAEILSEWGAGAHVSTQAGNVLACAAGHYVFNQINNEKFLANVNDMGTYFHDGLKALQEKHKVIGYIDNQGLYTGIELVKDRDTKEPAIEATTYVRDACLREGLLFEKGGYYHNRLQCIPPLNVTKEVLDKALMIFDKVFGEAEKLI